ncbi:uncharacterized protein LOC103314117 [Tribolium castaneum]|uniref:COMM domain-containing protein 8-like Protein n=1 Tax=Tribolium castaneum TaxID=7070 RepID=D6X063_TRICA|nr:PREDICTED: uncharacterized protein LOC103314117 [Tribolium castaneum]EFA10040.1 COMM domain-containing protein 8-like Protein [Tribolium castaneum]|eukprot:XP_008197345.1 PREDICTED: uncharacterized protein LOC103314117 [Tribolium castaneum]
MAEFVDSLLKISNSPVLQQFLHDCIDDLTGIKQASFDNYNSDIEWTVDDFNKAKKCVQKICRESVINNDFDLKTDFGENVQDEIRKCLELRKDDIFQTLVKEKLVSSGHNLVQNIDWKVKWVLGNSKLAAVREPLVQVDLHCVKNDDDKSKKNTVNFEANLEMLDVLIEQLQKTCDELNNK